MKKMYSTSQTSAVQTSAILWAGNDESFSLYINSIEQSILNAKGFVREQPSSTSTSAPNSDEDDAKSRLLQVVDGVGVITIHGALTNRDAWYNTFFGLVSYPEIVQAMHEAVLNPEVKEILMDVSSPGGAVDGVLDAVSAIQKVGKLKRVTGFTSSVAASAGFWIMAPAKERFVTETAIIGSIGVVAKHVEYSKMMKDKGVTETIVRSGEFKQIVNSSEPLSAKAEQVIQEQVDYTNGVFVQSIADSLGVSVQLVDRQMAQGKEFIGQQGVDKGLVTGVKSFEDVFAAIQKRVQKVDGGTDMKKKYGLTAALAAAAVGMQLEPDTATELAAGDITPDGALAPAAPAAPTAPAAATVPDPEPGPTPLESESETETVAVAVAAAVALLKAQLVEKDEQLLAARVVISNNEASLKLMKAAVAQTVNNLTVALGGAKDELLAEKDSATLLGLYEATTARVQDVFKSGGLAQHETEDSSAGPQVLSRREQALRAVTLNQKTQTK